MIINKDRLIKNIIAICIIIMSIFKMQYYAENTCGFNDLSAHLGYLSYTEFSDNIIPDFKEIRDLDLSNNSDWRAINIFSKNSNYTWKESQRLNYLGHPPLYYNIINEFNVVNKVDDDTISFNMQRIKIINEIIVGIGIILILYIGILLNLNKSQYFFYAIASTSIPMITYLGGILNNDNLGYIGLSILIISLINFNKEGKRCRDYLCLAIGIFICMMTKLTFGIIAVLISLIYCIQYCIKEKKIDILLNKKFIYTLPVYIVIFLYYINIIIKYGAVQPSLQNLDYEYFKATVFYVNPEVRVKMNFIEYIRHFFEDFLLNWSDIRSHVLVRASNKIEIIMYGIIITSLLLYIIFTFIKGRSSDKLIKNNVLLIASISILIAVGIQFFNGYFRFENDGYLGGTQSRYYIAGTFIMVLTFIEFIKNIFNRNKIYICNCIFLAFGILLLISDLNYFIL